MWASPTRCSAGRASCCRPRRRRDLPGAVVEGITTEFLIPQAAIKVWDVKRHFSDESFATGVSEDARAFASSLGAPYCGVNLGL